jgi:hypothetical protein
MKINIKTFIAVLFSLFLFSQCMIVSGIGSILQGDGKKSDSSLLGLLALATLNSEKSNSVFILPMKTGQTISYFENDDGALQIGKTRSYGSPISNSNYPSDFTTKDNSTGLIWKTCSQGLSGATCGTGSAIGLSWNNASDDITNGCNSLNSMNSGKGYAELKTWRLPTRLEFEDIVDFSKISPSVNNAVFPVTSSYYWSSTTYAQVPLDAWYINFDEGFVNGSYNKNNTAFVRCVSGSIKNFSKSFTDKINGTILDNLTGLIWQKCSLGQINDSTCSGSAIGINWSDAIKYCNGLTLDGKTWRLPQVNEVKSILDITKTNSPYIDSIFFPNTVSNFYWSSTTFIFNSSNAWEVNFSGGTSVNLNKNNSYYVRCVSGP